MPIPNRKPGEQRDAYIGRCISNLSDEYPKDQAAAICYQQLKKVNMQEEVPAIPQEEIDYCLKMLRGQNPSYVGPGALKICIARLSIKRANEEEYGI